MKQVTSSRTTQQAETGLKTSTKVKLLKPHTHAGVECKAGTEIDVDAPTLKFLIKVGVIADPEVKTETAPGDAQ